MSKLYCLFAGGNYYPEGGANDFRAFGTEDELKALYAENSEQWARDAGGSPWGHIAECDTMEVVLVAEYFSDSGSHGFKWKPSV